MSLFRMTVDPARLMVGVEGEQFVLLAWTSTQGHPEEMVKLSLSPEAARKVIDLLQMFVDEETDEWLHQVSAPE